MAARLAEAGGVSQASVAAALPGLNRCFARRLPGRSLYKPLDCAVFTTFVTGPSGESFGGSGIEKLPPDVMAELALSDRSSWATVDRPSSILS